MYFAKGTEPTEYCMDHVDDKEEFEKRLKKRKQVGGKISSLVKIADGHPSAILFTNNARRNSSLDSFQIASLCSFKNVPSTF